MPKHQNKPFSKYYLEHRKFKVRFLRINAKILFISASRNSKNIISLPLPQRNVITIENKSDTTYILPAILHSVREQKSRLRDSKKYGFAAPSIMTQYLLPPKWFTQTAVPENNDDKHEDNP